MHRRADIGRSIHRIDERNNPREHIAARKTVRPERLITRIHEEDHKAQDRRHDKERHHLSVDRRVFEQQVSDDDKRQHMPG